MLKQFLQFAKVPFKNDKIDIPDHIKHIKLDIGISVEAIHTENWLNHNPNDLIVFGFDPLPKCISSTIQYFQQPKSKWEQKWPGSYIDTKWLYNNFFPIPIALGNKSNEMVDFYVTDDSNIGCSSLYEPNPQPTNRIPPIVAKIKVPVFTLSDFFELLPLDKIEYIEYIKIDVQGSDLDIIMSGGDYVKDKVVFVTLEPETTTYHNAEHNNIDHMINYMSSINFIFINHPNTHDPTFVNRKFLHIAESIYICQDN